MMMSDLFPEGTGSGDEGHSEEGSSKDAVVSKICGDLYPASIPSSEDDAGPSSPKRQKLSDDEPDTQIGLPLLSGSVSPLPPSYTSRSTSLSTPPPSFLPPAHTASPFSSTYSSSSAIPTPSNSSVISTFSLPFGPSTTSTLRSQSPSTLPLAFSSPIRPSRSSSTSPTPASFPKPSTPPQRSSKLLPSSTSIGLSDALPPNISDNFTKEGSPVSLEGCRGNFPSSSNIYACPSFVSSASTDTVVREQSSPSAGINQLQVDSSFSNNAEGEQVVLFEKSSSVPRPLSPISPPSPAPSSEPSTGLSRPLEPPSPPPAVVCNSDKINSSSSVLPDIRPIVSTCPAEETVTSSSVQVVTASSRSAKGTACQTQLPATENSKKWSEHVTSNGRKEEDDGDEQDEDEVLEDDESLEGSSDPSESSSISAEKPASAKGYLSGRGVTLQMLIREEILLPGENVLSIEYMGQTFRGDLLPDGRIKSCETREVFGSPSAWAVSCKRIVNPEGKSGCGWSAVRYKSRTLEFYKNLWTKQRRKGGDKNSPIIFRHSSGSGSHLNSVPRNIITRTPKRPVVKHEVLGMKHGFNEEDALIESTPFSVYGKMQPFTVSMTTNALLVMDFHASLTSSEVVGYLGGTWDVHTHNLSIESVHPVSCRLNDHKQGRMIGEEIRSFFKSGNSNLVGWYHSHPTFAPYPSVKDVETQLEYQLNMKGDSSDSLTSYTPTVGVIVSPYSHDAGSLETLFHIYWVMPPPEHRPNDKPKPMLMEYTVASSPNIPAAVYKSLESLVNFYIHEDDFLDLKSEFLKSDKTSLWDKVKASLALKLPAGQNHGEFFDYLAKLLI